MQQMAFQLLREKGRFNFKDLFSICLGKVFSNKIELDEYIGHYGRWDTDVTKGELLCDNKRFNVEYIGTSSKQDGMWFSAELEKQIPDEYLSILLKTRNLMKSLNLTNLAESKIPLNNVITDEKLAIIYTAFSTNEKISYYVGNSGDIKIFMFVKDFDGENVISTLTQPIGSHKFIPRVQQMLASYDVDHKLFIKSFLIHNRCRYQEIPNKIIGTFGDKSISFEFDNDGYLTSMSGVLN